MRKWIKRFVLGTAGLLLLVVAGVVLYVRTAAFDAWLRDQIVAAADPSIRGDVFLGAVEGSIWTHLSLRDVRLSYGGEGLLTVPEVRLRYSLLSLFGGRLDVTGIELVEPWIRLHQGDDGVWTLATAVEPTEPAEPAPEEESGGLPIDLSLPSIRISGGRIEIEPAAEPRRTFTLADVELDASASLASGKTEAKLRGLGASLTSDGIPTVEIAAAGGFEAAGEKTSVVLDAVDVRTSESAVHVEGAVADLAALDVEAELRVERLASEEMRGIAAELSQEWPLAVDLAATVRVQGSRDDLEADLHATAGSAGVVASANANLAGEEPRWEASLTLAEIRADELLGRSDLAGVLGGDLRASGVGTALEATTAEATLHGEGLRLAEAGLGDLSTRLELDRGEGTFRVDLVGSGRAHVEGDVSIAAERFALRADVDELDLGRIGSPEGSVDSELNLAARIEGTGFSPETMRASLAVDLEPSRVGEVAIDRGKIDLTVAEARARIAKLELLAARSTVSVAGEVGLSSEEPVDLDVAVRVSDVGPWLDLVGQSGSGGVAVDAEVAGTIAALALEATVDAADLRTAGVELAEARLEADVANLGATTAKGDVDLELRGLKAGLELPRASLAVDLAPGTPPHALLELDAEAQDGLRQRLRADVAYGENELVVALREISLAVPTGVWELDAPARIVRTTERIEVERLVLSSSGNGSVAIDGAVTSTGAGSDLGVRIADVALAPFQVFAPSTIEKLGGELEADFRLRGSLEAIDPSGTITLRGGTVGVAPLGVTIREIELATRLAPDRIDVARFSARAGKAGRFDVDGNIGLRDRQPDAIDLHVEIARWPAIDNDRYQAQVAASIDATGQLASPDVRGRFEVLGARLRPPISMPNSSGPPPRDATIVVVQEEREKEEGEGGLATAAQETDLFRETSIDLEIAIDRGTWVEKDDTSLELEGELTVRKSRGDPDPAVLGTMRVVRGWIYLYGRRFEPEQGTVTFTGGRKIDPSLDIVLDSRVGDYQVSTIVTGTASEPKIEFESEPYLEDADILAVLMFGQPVGELGEGEKVALEQQAAGLAANYAAGQLGRALGDAFGFRISELDVTKGVAGVGRYVTDDTYVSVKQGLKGTETTRQVEIEHFLTPQWTVKTQTDTKGASGLDLFWQKKY